MNKSILTHFVVLLFFTSLQLNAQDKIGIALGNSSNSARISAGDISSYESAALLGIRKTKICTTLERKEWETLLKERGIQKTEEFLDGTIVTQSASLGAEYMLIMGFHNLDYSDEVREYKGKRTRYLTGNLMIGAKLVSVETGEVAHEKVLNLTESKSYVQGSSQFSINKSDYSNDFRKGFLRDIEKEFTKFAYDAFPPTINIIRVVDEKKGKAKTVYCKTTALLQKSNKLDVYTEEVFDFGEGDTDIVKKDVGELIIVEVQSARLVLCKVRKGGKEILKALENKVELKCSVNGKTSIINDLKSKIDDL